MNSTAKLPKLSRWAIIYQSHDGAPALFTTFASTKEAALSVYRINHSFEVLGATKIKE